jgi:hypothetical protein
MKRKIWKSLEKPEISTYLLRKVKNRQAKFCTVLTQIRDSCYGSRSDQETDK